MENQNTNNTDKTIKTGETPQPTSARVIQEAFGKYRIERKLGQGGMGAVYLAFDPVLNRRIALKTLQLEDIDSTARFIREARSTAKLKHPNIVNVYEAGVVGKTYYLTMDFINGVSLADLIKKKNDSPSSAVPKLRSGEGQLTPQRIAGIVRDVALALNYAHNNNIIHRDIKPGNILIDKAGKVYLTDFGLAKELSGLDRSLTMSGTAVGTPDYMSPEQAMGKKDEVDKRSDIFSLGATLYHTLTGRAPFQGNDLYNVLNKVVNHDPPTPNSIVVVHKDLETICLKCLHKDRARRYQSASELAEDLGRFIEGEPIQARRLGTLTRIWLKARKNKVASIAILSSVFILLLAIIAWQFYSYRNIRTEQDKKQAETERQKAVDYARTLTEALLEDLSNAHEEALERRRAGEPMANLVKIPERILNSAVYQKAGSDAMNNHQFHYSLGKLYRMIGDTLKAMKEQNQALTLNPDYVSSLYERGWLKYHQYQIVMRNLYDDWQRKEAQRRLNAPLENAPKIPADISPRDLETDEAKRIKSEALDDLKASLKGLEADSPRYLTAQGIIDFIDGNTKSASAKLKAALEKDRAFDEAVLLLAAVYESKKDITSSNVAIQLLTRAIDTDRGNVAFLERRAQLNMELFAYSDMPIYQTAALNDWDRVLKLQPDNYLALLLRGKLHLQFAMSNYRKGLDPSKYFEKSRSDLNRAIEIDPSNPIGYRERAMLNSQYADFCWGMWYNKDTGKDPTEAYLQAARDMEKALELEPTDVDSLLARAGIWINFGNYTKSRQKDAVPVFQNAVDDAAKAIKVKSDSPTCWYRRGEAYSCLGLHKQETGRNPMQDYKKSENDFRKALELANPSAYYVPSIWDGLGSLYDCWGGWKMSHNEDATEYYLKAEEAINRCIGWLNTDSRTYQHRAMTRTNLAIQLTRSGHYQKAIDKYNESIVDWEKAIELDPSMKETIIPKIQDIRNRISEIQKWIPKNSPPPEKK
ncbi:MAG: protein kinase [Planctomycetota bacterium]